MLVLVTGGAGFIGSSVTDSLLGRGDQVICLDNFNDFYSPAIKRANIAHNLGRQGFRLCEGDLTDAAWLQDLFDTHDFDGVIHLAAWAGVRPSIERPELYAEVNVGGTVNLLQQASRRGVEKFVFASSSSVYGGRRNPPFKESDEVNHPVSPYAATKKAGELLCYTFHHLHGLPISCLRYFTVYGPRQRPEMAIHKFTRHIHEGRPVPLFGDGSSSRDYTYIDDIVDGTLRALEHCKGYDIFNLGEAQTTRLIDLVQLIARTLDVEPVIQWLPDQPGDVPTTCADISRARDALGYAPSTPVEVGLPRFVEWYLQNRNS